MTKVKYLFSLLAALLAVTACDKTGTFAGGLYPDSTGNREDGYFVATFIPSAGDPASKSAVRGYDDRIQSLRYMIFREDEASGEYVYVEGSDTYVFEASDGVPQMHEWPLEEPVRSEPLPYGNYKVVFLGNVQASQFAVQDPSEDLVTLGTSKTYSSMRINMPSSGLSAFSEKKCNLYYLATADFSNVMPNPTVILQRVMSRSTFSRELVDTQRAVDDLVSSVVRQVAEGQLSTDLVRGVLTTKLTEILSPVEGLTSNLTQIVDRLVNILLGDIVTLLNNTLLKQVEEALYGTLKAGGADFDYLDVILNPWSHVQAVNVSVKVPKSIGPDRKVWSYMDVDKSAMRIPLDKPEGSAPSFTLLSLAGELALNEADVEGEGELIQPAVIALDASLLAGTLVNIRTPVSYIQESNCSYSTMYDLLRLKLADDTMNGDPLAVNVNELRDVIGDLETVILGDGILSLLIGALVDDVVQGVLDGLLSEETGLLATLDVHLPNLAIGNITAEARWGATYNDYDGSIIVNETDNEN